MGIRSYFRGAVLARMSSGTYCIIRPLGLVKGGKGLKHHENLLTLTVSGVAVQLVAVLRRLTVGFQDEGVTKVDQARVSRSRDGHPTAVLELDSFCHADCADHVG